MEKDAETPNSDQKAASNLSTCEYYKLRHVVHACYLNEWMSRHNSDFNRMHRYLVNQAYMDTLCIKYIPALTLWGVSVGRNLVASNFSSQKPVLLEARIVCLQLHFDENYQSGPVPFHAVPSRRFLARGTRLNFQVFPGPRKNQSESGSSKATRQLQGRRSLSKRIDFAAFSELQSAWHQALDL